jgi:tetratricopeptide (TPR) repeat protein
LPASALKQDYSRKYVRRLLDITERQLRSWELQGVIQPTENYSFSGLIALKAIQELRKKNISARRIGRAVAALSKTLEDVQQPLSELKIASDGRTLFVQLPGEKLDPLSGQILFDFDTAELGRVRSFPAAPASHSAAKEKEAEFWFQRGLSLEEAEMPVEQSIEAYKKALSLNPKAAGALVNLGTLYFRLHKFTEARTFYELALEADPAYPLVYFNLGNLCDEEGDAQGAFHFYERALGLNPQYADAHFNLGLLNEKMGNLMKAVYHWKAYLKLDPSSSWSSIARRQLERLREYAVIRPEDSAS